MTLCYVQMHQICHTSVLTILQHTNNNRHGEDTPAKVLTSQTSQGHPSCKFNSLNNHLGWSRIYHPRLHKAVHRANLTPQQPNRLMEVLQKLKSLFKCQKRVKGKLEILHPSCKFNSLIFTPQQPNRLMKSFISWKSLFKCQKRVKGKLVVVTSVIAQ